MSIATWNSIFTWCGIMAAVLTAFSVIGSYWTGNIISTKKDKKIETLEIGITKLKPKILSQSLLAPNEPDGKNFTQIYRLVVSPPSDGVVFKINFKGKINIIKADFFPVDQSVDRENSIVYRNYSALIVTSEKMDINRDSIEFTTVD